MATVFIPQITVSSMEEALQAGWIARGPNNRIVAGPGDFQLVKNSEGKFVPAPVAPKPAKPHPIIRVAFDRTSGFHAQQVGNEVITVYQGPYLIYDALDGKPPLVFHAQRAVTFSPVQKNTETAAGAKKTPAQYVTGVYLEGDVSITAGGESKMVGTENIHADRIYYDFTAQRAVMLDATVYTMDEKRAVPLYMRASQIRMLARGEYAAKNASFSTSEFYTPHYSIGASNLYLQDITPRVENPAGAGQEFDPNRPGAAAGQKEYAFKAANATLDFQGIPIFYWPYLSGDTANNDIPLRKLKVSNSQTYGLSLETQWDLFALAGQKRPQNVKAALNVDEFTKRGPAGGVDADWKNDDSFGNFRSYGLEDRGVDRLGANRTDVPVEDNQRGRILARHQQDLGNGWSMNLEGSYISDPNFLQQFFNGEYETDKEQETSLYVKHQGDTDAISLLGKFTLYDFTSVADQVDDQYTTEKKPEAKYWRIGDSFLDLFTYYSESGIANLHTSITNFTPAQLALTQSSSLPTFLGPPAVVLAAQNTVQSGQKLSPAASETLRTYYLQHGFLNNDVARADSRHELDMPLEVGDLKLTPYVTGRVTAWDDGFASTEHIDTTNFHENDGNTTRLWGSGGVRSSMEFWKVYSDIDSTFWDVHQIRHVIEPQFNVFATGATQSRNDLQPFDRDVEGISRASGTSLALDQKWQTKRGGPGHWRNVDWLTLNVQWNNFWDKERAGSFYYPTIPQRGFYFASRPELSLVQNSLAMDGAWRVGEHVRLLAEANYDTTDNRLSQGAAGIAIDQTSSLSYFIGNRYVEIPAFGFRSSSASGAAGRTSIPGYTSDEWTVAMDYQLTRKYELVASESYDFALGENILSSFTIVRKLPRFVTSITVTYDANQADTIVSFSAYPEGLPELNLGSGQANTFAGKYRSNQ
jgi:hypothetical protein